MTSKQVQERFQLLVEYLINCFKGAGFQTKSSGEGLDIFSLASHHGNREYGIDFYLNNIRISMNLKRIGDVATLELQNNEIKLNERLPFSLAQDLRIEDDGKLKFDAQKDVKKSFDHLINSIRMMINDTASKVSSASHGQSVAGSDNSQRHLFPNNSSLQPTGDYRKGKKMKCIKGEYERTYGKTTVPYSSKLSSNTTSQTLSSSSDDGARLCHLASFGMNSSATKHSYDTSQFPAKLINPDQQHPYRIESQVNAPTDASNSAMNSSLPQINLHFDQRPYQQQTNDDNFQILLQSIHDVANSESGQISLDNSKYVSILNALTGQPSDNTAFDRGVSSNNNHDRAEPTPD